MYHLVDIGILNFKLNKSIVDAHCPSALMLTFPFGRRTVESPRFDDFFIKLHQMRLTHVQGWFRWSVAGVRHVCWSSELI